VLSDGRLRRADKIATDIRANLASCEAGRPTQPGDGRRNQRRSTLRTVAGGPFQMPEATHCCWYRSQSIGA